MFVSSGNGPTDNTGCGERINEGTEVMFSRSQVEEMAFS